MIRACFLGLATAFCLLVLPVQQAEAQAYGEYCKYATRTIVLLFDRTSSFDGSDKEALESSLVAIDQYLDGRTLFSLQTIGEDITAGRTVLEACIPDCPPSSMMSVFIGAECVPARANADRAHFKQQFYSKLRQLTEDKVSTSKSDIAARIVEVSRTLNTASKPLTQIIIFSDLIDNVLVPHKAIYSQPAAQTLAAARQKKIQADLKGTSVAVFGFGRSDIPPRGALPNDQLSKLRDFWDQWFKESGAKDVSMGFRLKTPK